MIAFPSWLLPEWSYAAQEFFVRGYGILLTLVLLAAGTQAKRFFISERWGGYAESSPIVDFMMNPIIMPAVYLVWLVCSFRMAFGWGNVVDALINVVLCYYYFIFLRWKSVSRGMGAPGFLSYWIGACVFILMYTSAFAPDLRSLALLVFQTDFALIIFSAGFYKWTAGYACNEGMELGMVNPQWGYWWKWISGFNPHALIFSFLNHSAWTTEIAAALFMLIPATRMWGGILIALSFLFVACIIRLTFLAEMVTLCGVLFIPPGSVLDDFMHWCVGGAMAQQQLSMTWISLINPVLKYGLITYLILLPLAHGGLFYNFYGKRSLPSFFQKLLERYTNIFGIIIWRVFSVDIINFYIRICEERMNGYRRELTGYGLSGGDLTSAFRFNHVGESIALACIFTSLKYYRTNTDVFQQRLLRYARTLSVDRSSIIVFQYWRIVKHDNRFLYVLVAEFHVNLLTHKVVERTLDPAYCLRSPHSASPIFEGSHSGSYAPRTS